MIHYEFTAKGWLVINEKFSFLALSIINSLQGDFHSHRTNEWLVIAFQKEKSTFIQNE